MCVNCPPRCVGQGLRTRSSLPGLCLARDDSIAFGLSCPFQAREKANQESSSPGNASALLVLITEISQRKIKKTTTQEEDSRSNMGSRSSPHTGEPEFRLIPLASSATRSRLNPMAFFWNIALSIPPPFIYTHAQASLITQYSACKHFQVSRSRCRSDQPRLIVALISW